MWQFWLITSGTFFVIEMITISFLSFWLGLGALITMIISFFVPNIVIQIAAFAITSTIFILATRPLIKKFVKDDNSVKTNVNKELE